MFGFGNAWDPVHDIPDLTGKIALVTGGNIGIGFAIVEQLAVHGAKVYLGARSEEKAIAAIRKIEDTYPSVKEKRSVVWHSLDLTEPADVIKSAKAFSAREEKLDILVNNAARLADTYKLSAHNIELSVAINHIGTFIFVNELMPMLKKTSALPKSDVRIIIMSSAAQMMCPTVQSLKSIENLKTPYADYADGDGIVPRWKRYAYTKVLNELFRTGLLPRVEGSGISILTTNPGMVKTEKALEGWPTLLRPIPILFGSTPPVGAKSALFAATAPEVKYETTRYHGAYLNSDSSITTPVAQARDKTLAEDLWNVTQEVVDNILEGKL